MIHQRPGVSSLSHSVARRGLMRLAEAATVVIGLIASANLAGAGYTIAGVVLGSAAIAYPVTVTVFGRTGSPETPLLRQSWSGRLRGLSWITYLIAFVLPAAWYSSDIGFGQMVDPRMHIGSAAFVDGLTLILFGMSWVWLANVVYWLALSAARRTSTTGAIATALGAVAATILAMSALALPASSDRYLSSFSPLVGFAAWAAAPAILLMAAVVTTVEGLAT